MNNRLVKARVRISNGEKTKNLGRKKAYHYIRANKHLSELENHMEEIMFIEYPDEADTNIYYGEHPDDFVETEVKK